MVTRLNAGNPAEIKSLTGLRGVAACFVMLYHFVPNVAGSGPLGVFVKHGYLAVDLFFVLSGFVMAMTYGGEFQFGFRPSVYIRFLLKRLGRVYPLYIVATLVCVILLYTVDASPVSWPILASNALLIQSWTGVPSLDGPGWSISTELAAYLLFPLLTAAVLFSRWSVACVAAAISVAVLILVATRADSAIHQVSLGSRNGPLDVYSPDSVYPLLRCLAGFTLGLFTWRLTSVPTLHRLAEQRAIANVILPALCLLLAVPKSDVVDVVLFIPLIAVLAAERSASAKLLGSSPLYWLGLVSYSIYLVHKPVIDYLRQPLMSILRVPHSYSIAGLLLALFVLVLARLTYYSIEKPGRRLSRTLISRRSPIMRSGAEPISLSDGM